MTMRLLRDLYRFPAVVVLFACTVAAQTNAYRQTNLASDVPGAADTLSPRLVNPWGVAFLPGQPIYIANNQGGIVTTHNPDGSASGAPGFLVPTADLAGPDNPTGIVSDPSRSFFIRGFLPQFIVASANGRISGWGPDAVGNNPVSASVAVDHAAQGDVYTGLAILQPACCGTFLAVANFHGANIEVFTRVFAPLAPPGAFTDPNLPAGYAPYGIQVIGERVFITYALRDSTASKPVLGAGNGIVSIFDQEGNFVRRFATGGSLNAPWGVTQASANFGAFSNAILVGNFGDGSISAFDLATGNFAGQLRDPAGNVIRNSGLHALAFRPDSFGNPDRLYFTAGISNEQHGLLGAIVATNGVLPDFSLETTPSDATVGA